MPNPIEAQIQERIHTFVRELDLLVRKSTLDTLRGILDGRAPAASRAPGRPRGAGRAVDLDGASETIVAHVQANDAQTVGQIVAATGVPAPLAKKAIARLLAERRLRKTGERRGTRYHAGAGRAVAGAGKGRRGRRRKAG